MLKRNIIKIIIILMLLLSFNNTLIKAHSGRTDASGGHYNRTTGEYHYHNDGSKEYSNNSDNYDNNYDENDSESDAKTLVAIVVAAICIYAVFKDDKK